LSCWISPSYGPFSLGAHFKTYEPFIYLIFNFFSGRYKQWIWGIRLHSFTLHFSPALPQSDWCCQFPLETFVFVKAIVFFLGEVSQIYCLSGPSVGCIPFFNLWVLGIVVVSRGEAGNADRTTSAASLKLVVKSGDILSCKQKVPGNFDAVQ
jgi:hypothetical protein